MISYNRVILTGKVVNQPRRQYRPDGSPVVQFMLELNHSEDPSGPPLNHDGTGQTGRGLINIVAFGKAAQCEFDLLQSGQRLLVVGRLNQRRWQTPEGRHRTLTEVIATRLRKLEGTSRTMDSRERGEEDEETC
ncbi:MAG: single-stranded DNA-binding protein [Thermodesulfobacteriota bacterium]